MLAAAEAAAAPAGQVRQAANGETYRNTAIARTAMATKVNNLISSICSTLLPVGVTADCGAQMWVNGLA